MFTNLLIVPVFFEMTSGLTIRRRSFRLAAFASLALSLVGLFAVCSLFFGSSAAWQIGGSYWLQIAVGYGSMALLVECFGRPLSALRPRYSVGAVFGVLLFLAGVLCGSISSLFLYHDFAVFDYVGKPLYAMGLYGLVPAMLIGVAGCAMFRGIARCMSVTRYDKI